MVVVTYRKQLVSLVGVDEAKYFLHNEFVVKPWTSIADSVPSF